jgi:hypothetical protein
MAGKDEFWFCLLMKKQLLLLVFICTTELYSFSSFSGNDTIKIGLLIPDLQHTAAVNGARLAIDECNMINGGKHVFCLEVRSMEGPWGTGARQVVDLVFNKKALAIISSVDGRNAHLAEQVSAKAQVVFMNAGSGDPSLSRAFVPWYFSSVPDDRQAAITFVKHFQKEAAHKISIVSDDSYDSRVAAENLAIEGGQRGLATEILFYSVNDLKQELFFTTKDTKGNTKVHKGEDLSDFTVVIGKKEASLKISDKLQQANPGIKISIWLSLPEEEFLTKHELMASEGMIFYSGGLLQPGNFISAYIRKYGEKPGPAAVYSYSAVNIFTAAAARREGDPGRLVELLGKNFDEKGNPADNGVLLITRNGRLIPLQP